MKILLASILTLTPVPALAHHDYSSWTVDNPNHPGYVRSNYQPGYSASKTCFREEYREEYVPGTADDPGYVRSWKETVEFPCKRYHRSDEPRESTVTRTYEEYDTNDCSDGKMAGFLLGGGAGAALSRGDGRWWAIPLGAVIGSHIGCEIEGG